MQYVVWRGNKEEYDLFSGEDGDTGSAPTLSYEVFCKLQDFLKAKETPALLPIQIAYYTGLRIGEACALSWRDCQRCASTICGTPLQRWHCKTG